MRVIIFLIGLMIYTHLSIAQCDTNCVTVCSDTDCEKYFTLDSVNAFECQLRGKVTWDLIDSLCTPVAESEDYDDCTSISSTPVIEPGDTIKICNNFIAQSNKVEYFQNAFCTSGNWCGFENLTHKIFDSNGNLLCCVSNYNPTGNIFNVGDTLRHCMYFRIDTFIGGCDYYQLIPWMKISDSTTASFKANPVCDGSSTCFTNTSAWGDSVRFSWDFNNDQVWDDTLENPCFTFDSAGTYPVTLITCSKLGPDSILYNCDTVTINTFVVDSSFSIGFNYQEHCSDTISFFSDSANCLMDPCFYNWNFGDGGSSADQNPVHIYPGPGTYNACLTVTNKCGVDSICKNVIITDPVIQSGFSYMDSQLTVKFTDSSLNADQWLWKFGDGSNSLMPNPVHNYNIPGTYQVCLITSNKCLSDTTCQTLNLTCSQPQVYSFSNINNCTDTVSFYSDSANCSIDSCAYIWYFGDGDSSDKQEPVHIYPGMGTYNVCLSITNKCGVDSICENISITYPPVSEFYYTDSQQTVTFTDSSLYADQWLWQFGNGDSSAEQNPVYTFDSAGIFDVCLYVSNNCYTDSFCRVVNLTCPLPQSNFNFTDTGLQVNYISTSLNADSLLWKFGDDQTSSDQDPVHIFSNNSTYTTCLISYNSCGSDTTCKVVTVEENVGFKDPFESQLVIYPNPAQTKLHINSKIVGPKQVQLIDLAGRTILSEIISESKGYINVSKVDPGMYILYIKMKEKEFVKKVLIWD